MPIGFHFVGLLLFCLFGLIGIGGTVFWIWMLVDCIQNKRLPENTKIIWILVIIFTHFIGALIYFFAGRTPSNQAFYQQSIPGQAPYQPYQQQPQGYPQQQPPPQGYPAYPPQQQPPQSYQPPYQQGYQVQQGTSSPGQGGGSVTPSESYEKPQASYPEQAQE